MNALLVEKVQLGETINCLLPRLDLNFPAGHHASPRAAEEQIIRGPIEHFSDTGSSGIRGLRNVQKFYFVRKNPNSFFTFHC